MKNEQLEFTLDAGEVLAPVSSLYKEFVRECLKQFVCVLDRDLFDFQIINLQQTFEKSDLYYKVNKQTRAEIDYYFSLPFEQIYKKVNGVELTPEQLFILNSNEVHDIIPNTQENNTNTDTKPKLQLVK